MQNTLEIYFSNQFNPSSRLAFKISIINMYACLSHCSQKAAKLLTFLPPKPKCLIPITRDICRSIVFYLLAAVGVSGIKNENLVNMSESSICFETKIIKIMKRAADH